MHQNTVSSRNCEIAVRIRHFEMEFVCDAKSFHLMISHLKEPIFQSHIKNDIPKIC